MSVTTAFASDILSLLLTATPIANVADNAASSPITSWYVSLHTASPGAAGTQETSEAAYTGYARLEITRDTDGFTVVSGVGSNDAALEFGQCVANPGSNITHVGIGSASSGAGSLKIYGALSAPIIMQAGTVPIFDPAELDITCS
jgi:hypothetical protein